jgi:hypothetical protein
MESFDPCDLEYSDGICMVDNEPCTHPPLQDREICFKRRLARRELIERELHDEKRRREAILNSRKKISKLKIL